MASTQSNNTYYGHFNFRNLENPYYSLPDEEPHERASVLQSPTPKPVTGPSSPPRPKRSQSDTPIALFNPQKPNPTPQNRRRSSIYRTTLFHREIDYISPPTDDEIIIATVRITDSFRLASRDPNSTLPDRPRRRSFLRRMSTRLGGRVDEGKYTAIKMPRREYKKWFARDREGKYIGTEEEREWTAEELEREFGEFQDMPLRSVPGAREFGEGERWRDGSVDVSGGSAGGDGAGLVELENGAGSHEPRVMNGEVQGMHRVDGRHLLD